ncbi:MAG: hypothetical protein OEQ18_02170, partial [Gammaproteobacteria bacterium]|nr:hypothetical protein [Gammaproteobacteria bacterium]
MTTKTDAVRPLTRFRIFAALSAVALAASFAFTGTARAETDCPANEGATAWPEYTADVVVLDTAMVFNRLGAQNPNWVMYALKRDVINIDTNLPLKAGGAAVPGRVAMRPDKRPRPLVLRVPRCSKLTIDFTNLLANPANPVQNLGDLAERLEGQGLEAVNDEGDGFPIVHIVDDQVKTRWAGVHVQGLELATSIADDSSYVGNNANSCVAQGAGPTPFTFLAEHEGAFKLSNPCAAIGGEASGGNNGLGMWGMVAVQPMGARIYRSQVYEEELRLAADADFDGLVDATTAQGHPVIDYEAIYPDQQPWTDEGKANLPILNMICNQEAVDAGANCNLREIVHSEINAIVAGPEEDGTFGSDTYPLENVGIRNPAYPTRLEPFRDFASMFHDETATHNAFEGFFTHPVLGHTLHGVRDAFMINYGSGGIGSEIIANRLGVGPMYDCLDCAYEEFFLTSFTVGDPGMRVDVPANFGLENVSPETVAAQDPALVPLIGPKATTALFQDDPANIHNSYTGDHAKVRNIHAGPKEQHIYHQHNHQWLFNPNDDRANYLDAQGIGPGSSYTYEYVYGGMGNRNKTAGDAIFHCHFYPHFAQGMWYHMRIHDVTETGTVLQASVVDFVDDDEDPETPEIRVPLAVPYHDDPFELGNSPPALVADTNAAGLTDVTAPAGARNRAHPDGEILAGIPISAVVPLPGKPMAPMPGDVVLVTKDSDGDGAADSSQNYVVERDINPGYPFWIAGVDCSNGVDGIFDPTCAQAIVGQRPTTPPLDMITQTEAAAALLEPEYENMPLPAGVTWQEYETAFVNAAGGFDGGLPRHALGGCKDSQPAVGGVPQVLSCTHAPALHAVGDLFESAETRLDFHKEVIKAKGVFYPESGTDLEKLAMGYQAQREHATSKINLDGTVVSDDPETPDVEVAFIVNGLPPVPGAPYQDPCVDDNEGLPLLSSANPEFFAADGFFYGADAIQDDRDWDNPFTYAAANIQIDAVFNKVGYHYPQQRIIALWGDVMDTINKDKAPEPFVMRLNSFNCAKYQHSNLVPKEFEVDDYQVRTPTDII